MNTLRFGPSQHLELVRADADVAINGWDQPSIELTLDDDLDQCVAEQQEDRLVVTSQAAVALHIPQTTTVHVHRVSGDLMLRELEGKVAVESVKGDVSIRGGRAVLSLQEASGSLTAKGLSGPLEADRVHGDIQLVDVLGGKLEHVHGNVHARTVADTLELGTVSGDVSVRDVTGSFKIASGQGDLEAHNLRGGLEAGHIAGDLSLHAIPAPGQVYRARADGKIRAHFPSETSARFDLRSNSLVSAQLPQLEHQEPTRVIGQSGAGESTVILQAGSDLWVQMQEPAKDGFDAWKAMDSIAARIEAEIAQHLDKMTFDANTQRQIDNALRQAEQELRQAEHRLQQETQRAQQLAQRAQEKAAKAARRAQEHIARQSRSWGVNLNTAPSLFGPPVPKLHDTPQSSAVSPEEQLAILKMLQEGKISVQEAEALLKALEG